MSMPGFNAFNNASAELANLRKLFESPKSYLMHNFSELKAEVDVCFAKKIQAAKDVEHKSKLKENWSVIIKKINLYEKECLYMLKINKPNELIESKIKDFEQKLNQCNQDDIKQVKQISELVQDETFKLEKLFYLNRAFIFLVTSLKLKKFRKQKQSLVLIKFCI